MYNLSNPKVISVHYEYYKKKMVSTPSEPEVTTGSRSGEVNDS